MNTTYHGISPDDPTSPSSSSQHARFSLSTDDSSAQVCAGDTVGNARLQQRFCARLYFPLRCQAPSHRRRKSKKRLTKHEPFAHPMRHCKNRVYKMQVSFVSTSPIPKMMTPLFLSFVFDMQSEDAHGWSRGGDRLWRRCARPSTRLEPCPTFDALLLS